MQHTNKNLNLNLAEARKGRPWELFPKEYRSREMAREYPLPASMDDLQALCLIPLLPKQTDYGTLYLKRCHKEWKARLKLKAGAHREIEAAQAESREAKERFEKDLEKLASKAEGIVQGVQDRADKAIASLDTLFALGRRGIEGQMKAHLAGKEWQGEEINARAFRDCFSMVTRAVKGLGLPSDERKKAQDAVFQELAASMKATQEAAAMRPDAVLEEKPPS